MFARLLTSTLAIAGVLAAAGCASGSAGSSGGTYVPRTSPTATTGGSWAGEPGGAHINVSLSERKLYLKNGSNVVSVYSVGIGKEGYATPQGDYTVRRIVWNPPWNPPDAAWAADKEPQSPGSPDNPMKVVKIYFQEPDYYIHGTGSVGSLGGAVSHGCLRMAPSDAASLARSLMQFGGSSRDAAWFQQVASSNETQAVTLSTGVPMHVAP
jgi:lipoprotein-anchoring transpeptidase ErfK/SrfK